LNALTGDITALVQALASARGGKNIVFVMAPKQAAALKLMAGPGFDYPIISAALSAGTVIAMEISSFVSAFLPTPEFAATKHALLHMEDTSPQDITGAVPVKSLFQVDGVGLRMILRASWGVRAPGHVQVITGATW
jgi:hypothetical protein